MNEYERMKQDFERYKSLIGIGAVAAVLFLGSFSSFYTVEPEEQAVVIRLGQYLGTEDSGLHFKLPFGIDQVINVKTRQILQEEFGFRTKSSGGRRTEYTQNVFDNESLMLTGDLNVATVEWVVQYRIADPFNYLFKTNNPNQNIRDVSESIMRRVVGDRSVNDILTVGKAEIETEAQTLMQDVLDKYELGTKVISVKLQDVNPPNVVKPSFNEVNEAKQEQEKVINEAEGLYNKIIPEARGKAKKIVSEAEGYSLEIVNRAKGDVDKFNAVYLEYRRAPDVTKKRIYIETMKEVFGKFDNLTVVDPEIKGVLPIFDAVKGAK